MNRECAGGLNGSPAFFMKEGDSVIVELINGVRVKGTFIREYVPEKGDAMVTVRVYGQPQSFGKKTVNICFSTSGDVAQPAISKQMMQ